MIRSYTFLEILKRNNVDNPLTSTQTKQFKLCTDRFFELVNPMTSEDGGENNDSLKLTKDILITYYCSYSGNKFVERNKVYYPICRYLDLTRFTTNIKYLSRGLLKSGSHLFRQYATMGWMYNILPRSADVYENTIRYYYFSVCS